MSCCLPVLIFSNVLYMLTGGPNYRGAGTELQINTTPAAVLCMCASFTLSIYLSVCMLGTAYTHPFDRLFLEAADRHSSLLTAIYITALHRRACLFSHKCPSHGNFTAFLRAPSTSPIYHIDANFCAHAVPILFTWHYKRSCFTDKSTSYNYFPSRPPRLAASAA